MLHRINNGEQRCTSQPLAPMQPTRYDRNEREDMKTGMEYLYEFKKKLDELHPTVLDMIENMLQRSRW